jgi:DNA adenine methylase
VFLNTDYDEYLLADSNPDLINLYQQLVDDSSDFIQYCKTLFIAANNTEKKYYELREEFNNSKDKRRKSALFLYLNKHCYNGLCRYNKKGKFNTPFGLYKTPRLPIKEMQSFIAASGNTTFMHASFTETMQLARKGDVVYCDPPYAPLSKTAYFTDYYPGGFGWNDQLLLASTAQRLATRGIQVVISNHRTREICDLYKNAGARITSFKVQRHISCDGNNRQKADEILAVFG